VLDLARKEKSTMQSQKVEKLSKGGFFDEPRRCEKKMQEICSTRKEDKEVTILARAQ